jgi:hypothetical protein
MGGLGREGGLSQQWRIIGWNASSSVPTSSSQFIPRGKFDPSGAVAGGDFDSHVIFAAAHPVPMQNPEQGVRVYYMVSEGILSIHGE